MSSDIFDSRSAIVVTEGTLTITEIDKLRRAAKRKARPYGRNPEKVARTQLRVRVKKYGMTLEEYEEKLAAQGGRCAICQREAILFAIDHDHRCCERLPTCGQCNRDLLCMSCNSGLGQFGDDPGVIFSALAYITKYSLLTASRVAW